MPYSNPSDSVLREVLTQAQTIAVVGASSDPGRPSHGIFSRLLALGYSVIPVNPAEKEVLGQAAKAQLSEIGHAVDIVNVFRRSEATPEIAEQAVAIGARCLWLQQGIYNETAAQIAQSGGLIVVMDRCIAVEHSALRIGKKPSVIPR